MTEGDGRILVLGIGNVLMGDEGVGVRVVRRLQDLPLPPGVECLDGGTGGFHLLGPMQDARAVVLVDATCDGRPAGALRRLRPRYSSDYPPTLTAHDIGLKDLLDALYLLGDEPDITLFAVSIDPEQGLGTELTPRLEGRVSQIAEEIRRELTAASGDTSCGRALETADPDSR